MLDDWNEATMTEVVRIPQGRFHRLHCLSSRGGAANAFLTVFSVLTVTVEKTHGVWEGHRS